MSFRLQRKIDHHDRVLFYDTDQQDDPDDGNDGKLITGGVRMIIENQDASYRFAFHLTQGRSRDDCKDSLSR